MKPYDRCEFEWEREAFAEFAHAFPSHPGAEFYPNFHLFDESKKIYLEVDLLMIGRAFCAVVELKHWRGVIQIQPNTWYRGDHSVDDPHYLNLRKCKVLKTAIQHVLPAVHPLPFVHSIVVLTHPDAEVEGDNRAKTLLASGHTQAQITFHGVLELADYLRRRLGQDRQQGKDILSAGDFDRLLRKFDERFSRQRPDYTDQIPGYRITQEIEPTHNAFVYLAAQVPPLDRQLFRLRVFGEESADPQQREQQYRSLKALASLVPHPHIRHAWPHPNERKLVVEVSKWVDAMPLKQRLLETGCMRWRLAAKIALGVAQALEHIHNSDAAFIHRNVNPKAILLDCETKPVLTDFELVYDPAAQYTVMGEENEPLLTPYTAPETFRGAPDFKSDLYALGVTLYEMLAGQPPERDFQALVNTGGHLTEAHINALPSDTPDELKSLLRDMVTVALQHRPEASKIVQRLAALLGEENADIASLELKPGHTRNTWTLEKRIAEGTASEVYLGNNLGEKAVLKIYKPNYPRDLCVQERDMLASVDSPYVARYKSFMQWDEGRWCLVEEVVEGHSLRYLIETGQRPCVEDFQSVASQLLAALKVMHPRPDASPGMGVIHNDINPNNVIYNDKLRIAKLIDFGAASRPAPVSIRGTRGYIAPDLIDHGELDACPESDLYALAVTLFEWATGIRPETKEQCTHLVVEGSEREQLSKLTAWFAKALGIESKRFDSAQDMQQALEAIFMPPEAVSQSHHPAVSRYPNKDFETSESCEADRFVDYLNTIHNATASNMNALAEAQAISEFFGSIYIPFPLVNQLYELFQRNEEDVCILTGHAGDGKSTIALDLLKRFQGIAPEEKLDHPARAEETIEIGDHRLTIVKDMSELSAAARLNVLQRSLEPGSGSWLIVSNTGPLLNTFADFAGAEDRRRLDIENSILRILNTPIGRDVKDTDRTLSELPKSVCIINLAKLDNVDVASRVLGKFIEHPVWTSCEHCSAVKDCPIQLNVRALAQRSALAQERVRWIYTRLTTYEQRLTLRQMTAHLAFSVTAGNTCDRIRQRLRTFTHQEDAERFKEQFAFSETFFGYEGSHPSPLADALYCVQRLHQFHFGAHSTSAIERSFSEGRADDWIHLPREIVPTFGRWLTRIKTVDNFGLRQSLRRLVYIFGDFDRQDSRANHFLEQFLQSPMLRALDTWKQKGAITLSRPEQRNLRKQILAVLLEEYTGFAAAQYSHFDKLYLTLRRADRQVFQPTQLVLASFPFDAFELDFDQQTTLPRLNYRHEANVEGLLLALPILDYITTRSRGDLESSLDPIYLHQFDYYRAQLLALHTAGAQRDTITLLRVGVDGKVGFYNFELSDDNRSLEYIQ